VEGTKRKGRLHSPRQRWHPDQRTTALATWLLERIISHMMHIQEALEIAEENLQRYEIPPDKVGFFQRLCEHPETVDQWLRRRKADVYHLPHLRERSVSVLTQEGTPPP
jgi:hypothetical protein